jgi:hypothetical protein
MVGTTPVAGVRLIARRLGRRIRREDIRKWSAQLRLDPPGHCVVIRHLVMRPLAATAASPARLRAGTSRASGAPSRATARRRARGVITASAGEVAFSAEHPGRCGVVLFTGAKP